MGQVTYLSRGLSCTRGLQSPTERAGFSLLHSGLLSAEEHSLVIIVIASLKDVAELLREAEALFVLKVKQVVIQGGVEAFTSGVAADGVQLHPDSAHNNEFDADASRFVYERCQQLGIPLLVLSRFAAYGCQIPRGIYDRMAALGGSIGQHLCHVQRSSIERLWQRACAPEGSPARGGLPARCDRGWFCSTFCGGAGGESGASDSIWDCVISFNMYDPLALVAAVPELAERFFECDELVVGGTTHKVVGASKDRPGVKEGSGLREWLCEKFLEGASMETLYALPSNRRGSSLASYSL